MSVVEKPPAYQLDADEPPEYEAEELEFVEEKTNVTITKYTTKAGKKHSWYKRWIGGHLSTLCYYVDNQLHGDYKTYIGYNLDGHFRYEHGKKVWARPY